MKLYQFGLNRDEVIRDQPYCYLQISYFVQRSQVFIRAKSRAGRKVEHLSSVAGRRKVMKLMRYMEANPQISGWDGCENIEEVPARTVAVEILLR